MCVKVERKKVVRLKSIGFELEGGYDSYYLDVKDTLREHNVNGISIDGDGSVQVKNKKYYSEEIKFWVFYTQRNLTKVRKIIEELYNKHNFEQNWTCGNHRHIKFNIANKIVHEYLKFRANLLNFREHYLNFFETQLDDRELVDKYIARLVCKYCKNTLVWQRSKEAFQKALSIGYEVVLGKHDTEYEEYYYQKQITERDRYCFINFCAYNEHKTLEIRVYPHVVSAEEFSLQNEQLTKFFDSVKLQNTVYVIKHELFTFYVSRIHENKIVIEIEQNDIPNLLYRRYGSFKEFSDRDMINVYYLDRKGTETRLTDLDSIDKPFLLKKDNELVVNAFLFRVREGYIKIYENVSVEELVSKIVQTYYIVEKKLKDWGLI